MSIICIWQAMCLHYGFQSTGAHFINFINIKLEPGERHEDLFQRLNSFIEDNLLKSDGGIHRHGELTESDEELSPSLENLIVLTWLRLIDKILLNLTKKKTLLRTIQERKLQYFGHLIRGKGKQKLLMEGKIEGTRRKGKQRRTWTSDVMGWCGSSYTKCVRMAENRKEWSSMTADLLIRRWHPQ